MSVHSPRAYAAYAREVAAGPARSGSAPDSRRLRARVAVRFRLLVCLGELPHDLLAPVIQPAQPPLLPFGERVPGSLSGSTFPQLTASAGVAPDRPPVSTRASVI